MYINPNTTGEINNNIVYNTKGGFLVDRAFTTFNGNSWGIPPNEFDIVLLAGTTTGPPYNDIPALQAATIRSPHLFMCFRKNLGRADVTSVGAFVLSASSTPIPARYLRWRVILSIRRLLPISQNQGWLNLPLPLSYSQL